MTFASVHRFDHFVTFTTKKIIKHKSKITLDTSLLTCNHPTRQSTRHSTPSSSVCSRRQRLHRASCPPPKQPWFKSRWLRCLGALQQRIYHGRKFNRVDEQWTEESDVHRVVKAITTFHWQQHQRLVASSEMCCEEWRWTYQTVQHRLIYTYGI